MAIFWYFFIVFWIMYGIVLTVLLKDEFNHRDNVGNSFLTCIAITVLWPIIMALAMKNHDENGE